MIVSLGTSQKQIQVLLKESTIILGFELCLQSPPTPPNIVASTQLKITRHMRNPHFLVESQQ